MNTIDPQKAARVWQRVQETGQPKEQGLLGMIAREWTAAATYLRLSRRFQGKESAALRRLYEEEQAHAACLKGIYTLITGSHPTVTTAPPPEQDTQAALRRCYGQTMQCLADYEARSEDREYGPVFTRLAAQEKEHCRALLELLGNLKQR